MQSGSLGCSLSACLSTPCSEEGGGGRCGGDGSIGGSGGAAGGTGGEGFTYVHDVVYSLEIAACVMEGHSLQSKKRTVR